MSKIALLTSLLLLDIMKNNHISDHDRLINFKKLSNNNETITADQLGLYYKSLGIELNSNELSFKLKQINKEEGEGLSFEDIWKNNVDLTNLLDNTTLSSNKINEKLDPFENQNIFLSKSELDLKMTITDMNNKETDSFEDDMMVNTHMSRDFYIKQF